MHLENKQIIIADASIDRQLKFLSKILSPDVVKYTSLKKDNEKTNIIYCNDSNSLCPEILNIGNIRGYGVDLNNYDLLFTCQPFNYHEHYFIEKNEVKKDYFFKVKNILNSIFHKNFEPDSLINKLNIYNDSNSIWQYNNEKHENAIFIYVARIVCYDKISKVNIVFELNDDINNDDKLKASIKKACFDLYHIDISDYPLDLNNLTELLNQISTLTY